MPLAAGESHTFTASQAHSSTSQEPFQMFSRLQDLESRAVDTRRAGFACPRYDSVGLQWFVSSQLRHPARSGEVLMISLIRRACRFVEWCFVEWVLGMRSASLIDFGPLVLTVFQFTVLFALSHHRDYCSGPICCTVVGQS